MADRTVLITGASTGIGTACVVRLAGNGWRVYAGVRRPEDGDRLNRLTSAVGGTVTPIRLDVTVDDDVRAALDRIDDDVGSLDGLVNNAGIAVAGPVELVTDEEWRHQFEVNLFGVVRLTRSALPLVERAGGRFVHIGSINGRIAVPGLAPYAASKHALDAFNWALRAEVSPRTGMTSSLIEPGRVDTPIWAKARRTADDIERRLASSGTTERYRSLLDGQRVLLDQGGGVDPDRVAAVVERALTHRRPRARYLVGGDARLGGLLARLPERALEGVLALNARQLARLARRSAAASPDRGRS